MAKLSTITIAKTAYYYLYGEPGPLVKQLWIVCHGYAQTADEFLQNFEVLSPETTLVVAPEGLNHFYKKGFDGPVGANWMTRRHRESAIEDNCNYLQQVFDEVCALVPADVRVVLLGFSQGTATICRWVLDKKPRFDDLLLWAGLPPEDLDYGREKAYLADKNLYLLYGTEDPFLTPERISTVSDLEAREGIDFEESPFSGGHEIQAEVLLAFLKKLN